MTQHTELSPVLRRVFDQYHALQTDIQTGSQPKIDLAEMKIAQWETPFQRNPDSAVVEQAVEQWAREHGIWLDGYSEHTNTMGGYLHPETKNQRILAAIDRTYLILFYIDDTISNELQKSLSPEARMRGKQMMRELFTLLKKRKSLAELPPSEFGAVNATRDLLMDLAELGDPEWLERFMHALEEHLLDTVQDQNNVEIGEKFTVDSYLERRNDISGMFVTTWYMEFATGEYLRRSELPTDVLQKCERLEYLCALIGGVANDFYSFEKEVITHQDEFNLIPVMMMNDDTLRFQQAIAESMSFMNQVCDEFEVVSAALTAQLDQLPTDQRVTVETYLRQAKFVALASWYWEVDTDRYQRTKSIFKQTDTDWRTEQGLVGQLRSGVPQPGEAAT